MPNLGAGVDQHVNTIATPTWVFSPNPVGGASVRLYNEGSQLVYVGGANVTPASGLPLFPGGRPLELQNVSGTVYTCSNSAVGANTAAATLTSAVAAGATALAVGAAYSTTIVVGTVLYLNNAGSGGEYAVVASTGASAITVSTALLYDHASGSKATVATSTPGQIRVTAGVA